MDKTEDSGDLSNDEDIYNPSKQPGGNVWEPDPKTIVELYEKFDKEGILKLKWKSPGRHCVEERITPQKQDNVVQEVTEEDLKLQEKQKLLSMFEADDISTRVQTPGSLTKTPKTPKSNVKAKASFDKIFNKVSLKSTGADETAGNSHEGKPAYAGNSHEGKPAYAGNSHKGKPAYAGNSHEGKPAYAGNSHQGKPA